MRAECEIPYKTLTISMFLLMHGNSTAVVSSNKCFIKRVQWKRPFMRRYFYQINLHVRDFNSILIIIEFHI